MATASPSGMTSDELDAVGTAGERIRKFTCDFAVKHFGSTGTVADLSDAELVELRVVVAAMADTEKPIFDRASLPSDQQTILSLTEMLGLSIASTPMFVAGQVMHTHWAAFAQALYLSGLRAFLTSWLTAEEKRRAERH